MIVGARSLVKVLVISFWVLFILIHDTHSFAVTSPVRRLHQQYFRQPPSAAIINSADISVETPNLASSTSHSRSRLTRLNLAANDVIEAAVSFDTFAPQFLWLLMIAAPRSSLTKNVMGSITPILALAAVHLVVVLVAASQEGALSQIAIFGEVFDPSLSQLDGMMKLFDIRNFAAEEWPHVLVWDLFVGRIIWKDGIERDVDTRLSLSFCNFIGPPGLLIYAVTCWLGKKGLPRF